MEPTFPLIHWEKHNKNSTIEFWKVFWGRERKDKLKQLIFDNPSTTMPASRTLTNSLHSILTLSTDAHSFWALGTLILEPLKVESCSDELKARIRYIRQYFEHPRELGIDIDPASIEITPIKDSDHLIDCVTLSAINGYIITLKKNDPVNGPLPHRDLLTLYSLLVRVLRMAGRGGQDMLETFGSGDDISSLAANGMSPTPE